MHSPDGTLLFKSGATNGGPNGADHGPVTLTQGGLYTLTVDAFADDTADYQFQLWNVPQVVPAVDPTHRETARGLRHD